MTQPRSQALADLLRAMPAGTSIDKIQIDHYDAPQWQITFHDEYGVLGERTERSSFVTVAIEYDLVRALLRAKNKFRTWSVQLFPSRAREQI
jgi:hypothetical protein